MRPAYRASSCRLCSSPPGTLCGQVDRWRLARRDQLGHHLAHDLLGEHARR